MSTDAEISNGELVAYADGQLDESSHDKYADADGGAGGGDAAAAAKHDGPGCD